MTIYYVGKGGSDSNNGTTWALRKLTLNGASGAETLSLVAGDELVIGPGVYREDLHPDGWDGASGNEIIIRGDPSGIETDGVGGQVVLTGSDDDQTSTRTFAMRVTTVNNDFWIIRNIRFEFCSIYAINTATFGSDWIVEDCVFLMNAGSTSGAFRGDHLDGGYEIRRCIFIGFHNTFAVLFSPASEQSFGSIVENCLFVGSQYGVYLSRAVDVTVRNCTFYRQNGGSIRTATSTTGTIDVNNCVFVGADSYALQSAATGDIIEDYNTFWGNPVDRYLTDTGANSETLPPLFELPLLVDGYVFPAPLFGTLSERSTLQLAGSSETSEDLFGLVKPTVAAKSSWGAIQQRLEERETATTHDSSAASIKLPDAGEGQFFVPIDSDIVTISVQAYREANYAGTLPQMIIRQPGQSDRTTTDTGSVSTWNELTDTFTPSGDTDYVIVILRSLNTATSGSYAAFFDDLAVV